MLVSYRLFIVIIVLSVYNHSAAIFHRMSATFKSTWGAWVALGQNFRVFPLEQIPDVRAYRERTPQAKTNREIFEDFQRM